MITDFQVRNTPDAATDGKCEHVHIPGSELPPPAITYLVKQQLWRLEKDYVYDSDEGWHIHIRAGFPFDLASIPRPAWRLIAPFELSIAGPLVHDALYTYGGRCRLYAEVHPYKSFTRVEADKLFLRMMEAEGVSVPRRRAAYAAVRTFGRSHWQGLNG